MMPSSHERLRAALEHRESDRVPLDFGATKTSGICIGAYRALLGYLGWDGYDPEPRLMDRIQQLAYLPEPVLGRMLVDTRGVYPVPGTSAERQGLDAFFDEWGIGWNRPDLDGLYYDVDISPLPAEPDGDALMAYPVPNGGADFRVSGMARRFETLHSAGAGIVLNGVTSGAMEMVTRIRGYQDAMMDLVLQPDRVGYLLDCIVEAKMRYWERALAISAGRALVAVEVDDLGTQNGLLFSRDTYRSILFPRHRRLFDFIHRQSPGIKVFLHSCGAVSGLIPDLIEAGVDILNPVQTSAAGMDPVGLKRDFGSALVFWGGGVDTQSVLPFGTPDEVRDDVHRRLDIFAPGGGYVFGSIHNVQSDVPPRNLAAMLEAFGQYAGLPFHSGAG
jgi:uroporphyrinogen decarboxylase